MQKQQTVQTSLGQLTFTSLGLGDLRLLDQLFKESKAEDDKSISSLLKFLPVIHASARKVHQDLTAEQMESGIDLEDFNACFNAVLEVSGLKKGEANPGATPA